MKCSLESGDIEFISRLRAWRNLMRKEGKRLMKEANKLRDVDIAAKFEVSEGFVRNVPPWDGDPLK